MRKNIFKYLLTLLIVIVLFSCKDSFLDVTPVGAVNSNSFYSNKLEADQAVTAVYGMLDYIQCWDVWLMADLGSIASDDAEAGGATAEDVPAFQYIDRLSFDPSLPDAFVHPYGVFYKSIFLANLALKNLPDIPKKDPEATQDFINQRLAEVKFLRALNFFYLVQAYGEVPLVDHILNADEFTMGRSSMKSVFDQMEKDLTEAIPVLPLSYDASEIGRVTKGAAQGLLAKVYLFESSYAHNYPNDNYSLVNPGKSRFEGLTEKWADALAQAEEVINSGTYKLVGIDGERYHSWRDTSDDSKNTDGFRYVWTTNGNNSKETVFEVQCEYLGLGWLKARGSSIVWWSGVRWIYNPKNNKPAESKMWGFNVPSPYLLAEFNKEPGDPRFNTTIHKKDSVGCNDSINLLKKWVKICWNYTPTQYSRTGMFAAKYECSEAEFIGKGANWCEAPMNMRILRYADVVLIAAEAALMLDKTDKALTYLNMVRTRARMCGAPNNTVPRNLTAADLTSSLNTLSGPVSTKLGFPQLYHERRLELAMEGHRFFDLVRWNLATNFINGHYLSVINYQVNFTSPKNDFFPIPQAEVNTSQGNLKQYEGW
jgi:starch-binding outer membrane protein, SusD/RagB family